MTPRDDYSIESLVFDGNLSDRLDQSDNECPWNRELGNVLLTGRHWTVGTFGADADHSGSVYRNNTILSAPNEMAFGLIVGDEPWWNPWSPYFSTANADEIYGNTISGAVVNLAIEGIGAGSIHDNNPYTPDGWAGFFCTAFRRM